MGISKALAQSQVWLLQRSAYGCVFLDPVPKISHPQTETMALKGPWSYALRPHPPAPGVGRKVLGLLAETSELLCPSPHLQRRKSEPQRLNVHGSQELLLPAPSLRPGAPARQKPSLCFLGGLPLASHRTQTSESSAHTCLVAGTKWGLALCLNIRMMAPVE